jgi:hypothetical protein
MLPPRYFHWSYVWIPLFGAFIWFGTLLSMLVTWLAQGRRHYVSMEGSIAYISDIGADFLKPLFVAGCSITAVCFFLSLCIERWLRHSGRLIPGMRRRERVFSILAILSSFIGGCGLILLSVLDTKRHPSLHRLFLLIFMIGVVLSAIFTVVEYRWISKDFNGFKELQTAYRAKSMIAGILIILAIAFGVALYKSTDAGAVLEWVIALGFTLYLLTFAYDLRLSKGVPRGHLKAENGYGYY